MSTGTNWRQLSIPKSASRRSLPGRAVLIASLLLLAGLFPACSTDVKDIRITAENQSEIYERVRSGSQLTYEEVQLLESYMARQEGESETAKLTVGKTIGEMIEDERGPDQATGHEEGSEPGAQTSESEGDPSAKSETRVAESKPTGEIKRPEERPAPKKMTPPPPTTAVLPAGSLVTVRLDDPLSSKTNRTGQNFRARLDSDLMSGDKLLAPEGSVVTGRLTKVVKSGKVKGRAEMSLTLTSINTGSDTYDWDTSTLHFEAEESKKSDAKKIGIAAGAGALIGALTGGKKGAGLGAAIGAGAGTGATLMTRGKEIEFGVEQLFQFESQRDLELKIIRR